MPSPIMPFSPTQKSPLDRALSRMPLGRRAAGVAAMAAVFLMAQPSRAQDTRATQQAAERAEKATRLHPYQPTVLEQRLGVVDRALSNTRPVYLVMGSSFDGAGLAIGPGYRARYGETGAIDARATVSIRNYRSAEGKLTLPAFAHNRVSLDVHGSWIDAPRVSFFGTGSETIKENHSGYALRSTTVGVSGTVNAAKQLSFGASLDVIRVQAESSVESATLPMLDPVYRRTAVSAQFDSRDAAGYSRRGSLAKVEWAGFHRSSGNADSFGRIDAELQQFVPLMRENWVLAFRALASTTAAGDGNDVPYMMLPELGGSTLLRGFSSWRFRDRNRMLLTGEYRWTAGPLVDMALFVDAGKVTARRADLNFRNLEVSHGIGLRVHTPNATLTRLELVRSREGLSAILAFSPSF